MISLYWVATGGFAFLSLLCFCVFIGMRRMTSLGWLAATMVLGTIETLFLAEMDTSAISSVVVTMLTPLVYLCFAQAVRAVLNQRHQNWPLYGAVLALSIGSVVLKLTGVPFVARTSVFQLACALAVLDIVQRLYVHRVRGGLEWALLAVMVVMMGVYVFRGVTYPFIYPVGMEYSAIRAGGAERMTLTISALCSVVAVFVLLAQIINGVIVTYRLRSESDSLTGLLNHQAFYRVASRAGKTGGSVVVCDLDYFKSINDRFGHQAGDVALCAFADLLQASGYQAGRVGGEEFALIVPGLSPMAAKIEAERLRKRLSDLDLAGMPGDLRITASFGVAGYEPGEEPRQAFSRADAALYRAKAQGRNTVVVSEPAPEQKVAAA